MLDGTYTDKLNMLLVDGLLQLPNLKSGINNGTFINKEVHRYEFDKWSVEKIQKCNFDIDLKINDTKK